MNLELGLMAKKVGMTEYFEDDGTRVPVTVLRAAGNVITAHRTEERDGYSALQVAFDAQKASRMTKPELGQFEAAEKIANAGKAEGDEKISVKPMRRIFEIRVPAGSLATYAVGTELPLNMFEAGSLVDVAGTSKGKGFQGVIKRHNMRGEKASHGQHEVYRHGGSIGCRLTPGRVLKGKRMAGQMGNERVTVQNLTIARVIEDDGLLLVRGPIPGSKNGYVTVRLSVKAGARKRASAAKK